MAVELEAADEDAVSPELSLVVKEADEQEDWEERKKAELAPLAMTDVPASISGISEDVVVSIV